MELSPRLYHWFVRPEWVTRPFINKTFGTLLQDLDFQDKNVLDFGCGIGSICFKFDPEKYVGIDYDKRRIRYAQHLNKNYTFLSFNGSHIELESNSMDYILIMAVFHHISSSQINEYFQEFDRILKNDGKIIIIEPCFIENSPLRNWCMGTFDKGLYIRNKEGYIELFHKNNYQVNTIKTFCKYLTYNEVFFVASRDC